MGYNTRYSLNVQLLIANKPAQLMDDSPLYEVIKRLRAENQEAAYVIDKDGGTCEAGKWYEHEAEMKAFSLKHPSILFTLHGEGEESDDIWNEYYLAGKVQKAKAQVQIAPFDPKLLQ